MTTRTLLALAAAAAVVLLPFAAAQTRPAAPAGNAARGEMLYETRCSACHSIDNNRVGPAHRGVVGRRSATAPGFTYSAALRRLNVAWTPANIDRWLSNPTAMAPGTAMGISVPSAQDRADIIAYLATQRAP